MHSRNTNIQALQRPDEPFKIKATRRTEPLHYPTLHFFTYRAINTSLLSRIFIIQTTIKLQTDLLSSERGTVCDLGSTTGWLGEHSGARVTGDSGLGVREHSGDVETTWALDIHEERSWSLHKGLELVTLSLSGGRWVQQILNQNL